MMKIFVVIPSWNGADYLKDCLESLNKQTYPHKVILVDNGSTDNTTELLNEKFKKVIIVKNSKNLGFAGGVNSGIKYALENDADGAALFNNDAVADKNWLKSLVDSMSKEESIGIVASKIMIEKSDKLDSTGEFYSTYGIPFPRGRNQIDKGQFDKENAVFGASGGASLYRTKLLREIGIFDERFFAYYEDVDISFRAHLAGWRIAHEPKAIAYHKVGGTSSKMGDFTRYHSIKNFLILYTKDMPTKLYWKYLPKFLYQFARTTIRSLVDGKPHVWAKSVAVFLFYLPSILIDRQRIQRSKKISTKYIDEILYKERPPKIPSV